MFKNIVLFISVFALACVAYVVYQWQDTTPEPAHRNNASDRPIHSLLQTQPASQPAAAFVYKDAKIPPGDAPLIRVFNPDGTARIVFRATKWRPLSDTEFHVTQPTARVLLPGGQLAYIRSDEGQIVVQRDDKNNYNPKRGKLTGHVQLFIDRTTPQWRKENPELSEPEEHPEAIVKIWMDDVTFDLDLARLQTDGPIRVQSVDATVEGTGLTLIWNETSRRIKLLRIERGKRASIRMNNLVQLGLAGGDAGASSRPAEELAGPELAGVGGSSRTRKAQATTQPERRPKEIARASTIKLADLDDTQEILKTDRVDTYQIVFRDGIVVEQRQGLRTVGRLKADVLELLRDFGAHERSAVEHAPESRPAGPDETTEPDKAAATGPGGIVVKKDSTLELRWSGELSVTPLAAAESRPAGGKRFQIVAEGDPVEIHDRETGDATCRRLEYRDETQEIWLIGSPDQLVSLQADERRQLAGEKVFLDRRKGVARVEGPGRMTDHKNEKSQTRWPECIREALKRRAKTGTTAGKKDEGQVNVTWTEGVEIDFGVFTVEQADPAGGRAVQKKKEYLKAARFRGEVAFEQPGQSLAADRINITFAEPDASRLAETNRGLSAETLLAEGRVRMVNDESVITCDRLEVDMTTDDVGRNVPQTGRAFGHVVARQGTQEIRAADQMVVTLESIPKPIPPAERERLEAAAEECGYTPQSAEWQAVEEDLQSRRETVVRTLIARGDVVVLDPRDDLDVGADVLDCSFENGREISRALVMGTPEIPAHVSMTDFYIRGPQIHFKVTEQTVDVPGEGILRFYTKQDLSGGRLDEPVPVVVSWKNKMSFRGRINTGLFSGSVRAVSEGTILDCRELSLRFENLPREPVQTRPAAAGDPRWIAGRVIDLLTEREDRDSEVSAAAISRDLRKRLAYIQAVGDTVIASSEYEKPKPRWGPFSSIMAGIMPDAVKPPAAQSTSADQRLLSFVRINGPRITIDLDNEHMVVEGAGNLLVLDYRMPAEPSAARARPDAGDPLLGSLQSDGPSQTVFTWQNAMSYLNRRNVAVLDNRVVMKHAAGAEMAMPEQVAAAMDIDVRTLAAMKGRLAELTCENLIVEFARNRSRASGRQSSLSSATELKSFQASHRVRMQENVRAVEGEIISYDSSTALVRIQGSPQLPATASDIDEKTGAVPMLWRGEELVWNLKTDVITIEGASIMAPGR